MVPILLGTCFIIFVLFNMVAGDPTQLLLGKHATAKQMMELRRELGLDRPFISQYFDIVKSAFGDRNDTFKSVVNEILDKINEESYGIWNWVLSSDGDPNVLSVIDTNHLGIDV